jgi:hypothetical protein
MIDRLSELEPRAYPQTWFLLDLLGEAPRLAGQEVVDLSPGAIELRQAVRELRAAAENPERWVPMGVASPLASLSTHQVRDVSFGLELSLCVEHDERSGVHEGRPFRHLRVRGRSGSLTPATSAEVGLYFYGRRPADFGFVWRDTAHGYIGFDWERLRAEDVDWLLRRELVGMK